jgi:hypothetical protein
MRLILPLSWQYPIPKPKPGAGQTRGWIRERLALDANLLLRDAASDRPKNNTLDFAGEYSGNMEFGKEPDHISL